MQRKTHKNMRYSVELRIQEVEAYLRGEGSQREICKKFEMFKKILEILSKMVYNVVTNILEDI